MIKAIAEATMENTGKFRKDGRPLGKIAERSR
jgi:hypothetical protein